MHSLQVLRERIVHFDDRKERDLLCPGDRRPSRRQLMAWRTFGLKNTFTGERVTLEWARHGPSAVTSVEAFQRFLHALNVEE